MVYPALLPLMRTPRLPVVDWTDAPADLNGLVHFAERRNLSSARVPSHFNWPLLPKIGCKCVCVNRLWPFARYECMFWKGSVAHCLNVTSDGGIESFTPWPIDPSESAHPTHWREVWVGSTPGLNASGEEKNPLPLPGMDRTFLRRSNGSILKVI